MGVFENVNSKLTKKHIVIVWEISRKYISATLKFLLKEFLLDEIFCELLEKFIIEKFKGTFQKDLCIISSQLHE